MVEHKDSCALKSLFILSTGSITTFLSTSLSKCLKWEFKKRNIQRSEWNCEEIFSPTNICFLMSSIKWSCKHINKKKTFLWQNFLCGDVCVYHRGHLFYFRFMETCKLFPNSKNFLYAPLWALLILGAYPFSGSNLS